jgi:hypothetical protein
VLSAKRPIPPTNKVSKAKDKQRGFGATITREKGNADKPASSTEDTAAEAHRPKRRRLSNENAQVADAYGGPDLLQRDESILRNWVSVTPDRGPTRKEMASLADLTECSFTSIENWFKENGNLPDAPQFNPRNDRYPPSTIGNAQQDLESTCKSSPPEPLSWRRPKDPDMPYSCTHRCGRNFKSRGSWERHERINWGRKVWKCHICPKTFVRRDKLGTDRGHLKTVHKIEPTIEVLNNACQSNDESFSERCGFCGDVLRGWKIYINHVGGHFADKTRVPPWHMSMWRRPWLDFSGSKLPGDDDDDDDDENNDDGGNGYNGTDEYHNGGSNTRKDQHQGRPNGPSSRGGSSGYYGYNGSRSTGSTGRQCHSSLYSSDASKDCDLLYRDHSRRNTFHRIGISPISNLASRSSFEAFQQLLMQRSLLRKKSIRKFLNFYDPFEHTLCSPEFVVSHWMKKLEKFIEDMQTILPNELWTRKSSQLEFGSPLWKSIMPPVSIEAIFLGSWLPLCGDLHITICMTVRLVWTKIARLHMSKSLCGYQPYRTEHISDPLWPSPLEICKSPFTQFSNSLQLASSSDQIVGGLSGISGGGVADSEPWNGSSNSLTIDGQFVASHSVETVMSPSNNSHDKGTKLFVLCWLYVLLIDLPRRMPNLDEIKFLALLQRAEDNAIIPWIQEKVSPVNATSPERPTFPTTTIAPRSGHSPGKDVTCIATRASARLPWNKPRNSTRPYSCTKKCGWSFRKKGHWIKHETINLSREKLTCTHCQLCFAHWTDFKDHLDQVHQQPANISGSELVPSHPTVIFSEGCGFCGHRCGSWKHWTDHVGAHFENRIKGGPWVMSRWVHPWVDKDNALRDDFGSYEDHDRNGDNDDDHGNGDSGNGDGKGSGSGATGSCSNPGRADSDSNSRSKSNSRRQETQRPEANQGFSPWPQPPNTSTHPIRTAPDLSAPTFSSTGNPPRSNDFDQHIAGRAIWPLTADHSSHDDSIAASQPNPLIQGLELCDELGEIHLPDPIDTPRLEDVSTTITSSTSKREDSQNDHISPPRNLTLFLSPHAPYHISPHIEINLIPIPFPSFIRYAPPYLDTEAAAILKSLEDSIDYPGYSSMDSLLGDNGLSCFCSHGTCRGFSAFSGKGCLTG